MRRKILFMINDLSIGGAQKMLLNTLRFYKDDYEMHVMALIDLEGESMKEEVEEVTTVSQLKIGRFFNPMTWVQVGKEVARQQPDLIISHMFISNLFARIIGFLLGIKVISFEHNLIHDRNPLEKLVDRVLSHTTHQICAVSEAVKHDLVRRERIPERRIKVIPNAVESPQRISEEKDSIRNKLQIPQDENIILSVTRIIPQKDIPLMISTVEMVRLQKQNTTLIILGEGKLLKELKKNIQARGLEKKIRLLGFRKPAQYYKTADLYLNTSKKEGLSISLLEALSYSLPIVASNVGGNSEVVKNGINGIVIDSRNPKDYSNAIIQLLGDQKRMVRLRRGAGKVMKHFSISRYKMRLDRIITSAFKMPRRVIILNSV